MARSPGSQVYTSLLQRKPAQVLTLAAHGGCQTAFLAAHFGERLPHPCGHCSWCENGGKPAKLLPPSPVHLDEAGWTKRACAARRPCAGRSPTWPSREPSPAS
ncbi:MAG: RecQ family zinc-binding domain-containing protein [Thermoanaerobaculia bacterium]